MIENTCNAYNLLTIFFLIKVTLFGLLKKTMRLVQQSFTRWHLSLQEKEKMCVRVIFRDDLVQSLLSEVTPDEQDAKRV